MSVTPPPVFLTLPSPRKDLILRQTGTYLRPFFFLSETETAYSQKLASLCAIPVRKEHVFRRRRKGSGLGDFHNYASQAPTTIQLTVFSPLPSGPAPALSFAPPALNSAFSNTPALLHFTISKWLKKKKTFSFSRSRWQVSGT